MTYTFEQFHKKITELRRTGNWYCWNGIVNGKSVMLKGFETWLHRFIVDGQHCEPYGFTNLADFEKHLILTLGD